MLAVIADARGTWQGDHPWCHDLMLTSCMVSADNVCDHVSMQRVRKIADTSRHCQGDLQGGESSSSVASIIRRGGVRHVAIAVRSAQLTEPTCSASHGIAHLMQQEEMSNRSIGVQGKQSSDQADKPGPNLGIRY